jgi:hypothetical protein
MGSSGASVRSSFAAAWLLLGAAVASAAVPAVARADSVSDAKDLFARGRELRARADCAAALPLFRKAYALYPDGLGSLRNAAECEEGSGHFASARRAWLDLKRALLTHPDPKYEGWVKDADEAAARLAPKLASLTVAVNVVGPGGEAAPNEGVEVTVNGEKLAPALVGTPLERDPGRYDVRAVGPSVTRTDARVVDLVAGDAKRVALRVVVAQAAPEPAAAPPPSRPAVADSTDSGGARRTAAWLTVGVGAAALAGAGVSLIVRQSALGDLQSRCPGYASGPCDPSLQGTVDRGHTASTLVTVLGAVGLVAVATGVTLLVTGKPQPPRMAWSF